ncbi:FHA domain-containing protein, partial [Crocinitomicaceae bacterium]|nr:FHA domain-containing protein [Crocinitomicaceae bacterium]
MSKGIKLGIIEGNERLAKFVLEPGMEIIIGKQDVSGKNTIKIAHKNLSRQHAQLMMNSNGELYIVDLDSTNGTFVDGRKIKPNVPYPVGGDSKVSFAGQDQLQLVFNPDDFKGKKKPTGSGSGPLTDTNVLELLNRKAIITIGRSSSCDLTLPHNTISKAHASIEKKNNKYYLKDLGSLNGTFINGRRITHETEVRDTDKIIIGRFIISIKGKARSLSDEVTVRVERIVKKYSNGYVGLHQSTFEIPSKSILAVMGPSGCGKSTLLKALCGDSPPSSGNVFLFGMELNDNYDFLKTQIGYVPQDDIVHRQLTVEQSLYYAAKLRLPNAKNEFIHDKINQVLEELNITHIRKNLVGEISGGQRKRVSIGVEILTDPMVLFLDEPTSPLDPQTIEEFLGILRRLTEKGTTVIMVTHKPDDLDFMDSVIFMAEGGHIAYHNTVDGFKDHFQVDKVRKVYGNLEQPNAKAWIDKYNKSRQSETTGNNAPPVKQTGKTNPFSQYRWLVARYFKIKFNDWKNMAVMIGQAPIIAILICLIFENVTQSVPFLMTICAIWFGSNNAAREIVSELPIYKRERMFNQGIFPYIFSKITVLGSFAAAQAFLFTLIISINYTSSTNVSVAWNGPIASFTWILFVSLTASMMGLLLSALVTTTEKVMSLVPLVLIPQIMLAGVMAPIQNGIVEFLSYITLSR